MNPKKILITGSTGMLGSDLVSVLADKADVCGIARTRPLIPNHQFYQGDLSHADFVEHVIAEEKPDLIFHTAAMTQVDECETRQADAETANVDATVNLARAAERNGSFLVYFSTDYVFNGKKSGEYTEEDSPDPLNVYGETKHIGELTLMRACTRFMIFRISWLYGRGGSSFPKTILTRAETQKTFRIVEDQIGRPTYTRDIAQAMSKLIQSGGAVMSANSNEIFHLANQGVASWADFAEYIFHHAGLTVEVERIPTSQLSRPAKRPLNSVLSLFKTRSRLGIEMRSWQDAALDFLREFELQDTPGVPR